MLVSASRRNSLSLEVHLLATNEAWEKVREPETASPARETRVLPRIARAIARDICCCYSHNLNVTSRADRYAQLRDTTRVRERTLFHAPRIPSELELQARWFAGDLGQHFVSTAGDEIDIVQFGTWNREAGPDFRDAAIRINGSEPVGGCIEIDLLDRSWETHDHAINPAFDSTVLHVFVEKSEREFFTPQNRIAMSRRCALILRPCPRSLTPIFHWRGRDAVRRR